MTNVIDFPVIPRKAADRGGKLYRCIRCLSQWVQEKRLTHAVYCGCGAEMRPVEAK